MNQLTNLSSAEISAQHEQDAKDLTRILPASKKFILKALALIFQVPIREISLTDTLTGLGGEHNPVWYMTLVVFILTRMFKLILNSYFTFQFVKNGLKSVTILTFFLA